jgi:cytochrome bd-type quinol oxidase subunit 2
MLGGHLPGIDFLPSVIYPTLSLTEQSRSRRSLFVLAVVSLCMVKSVLIGHIKNV